MSQTYGGNAASDCESEEVINTNKRNTNADMCVESVLQAIIQK